MIQGAQQQKPIYFYELEAQRALTEASAKVVTALNRAMQLELENGQLREKIVQLESKIKSAEDDGK